MVLLDWEKAFDKVSQKGMIAAMERMGIDTHLIDMTKMLYKNPKFKMEIDGISLNWYKQATGIRQGCPLSPYLFLIIMTVVFYDIHKKEHIIRALQNSHVLGTDFNEVLYADDTILITNKKGQMDMWVREIEKEGENMEWN